jgi:large subunit ribosomal protein L24
MPARLKKGDQVMVLSGKDKGKKGKVLRVIPKKAKVVVERVGVAKKHQRRTQKFQGGIIEKPMPVFEAKLMLICPKCGEASRLRMGKLEDGSGVRFCKACDQAV